MTFSSQEILNIYQMLLTTPHPQWASLQPLSILVCGLTMDGIISIMSQRKFKTPASEFRQAKIIKLRIIEFISRNLPRSIMIAIPLVTLCYALINISYLAAMSPDEMIESEAVAVTFGNRILGLFAWIMPLSVTISTFGSANGTLFAAGRLCFAASREGHLLDILSYVHIRRLTPAPGLIFHSLIAGAMVLYGTIDSLIDFFSFTAWIFYGGAMLALIVMRFTKPNYPRPYKVPIIIPWVVLVISAYLVIGPIIDKPQIEYLYTVLFILCGLVLYLPFVRWRMHPPFMSKFNLKFDCNKINRINLIFQIKSLSSSRCCLKWYQQTKWQCSIKTRTLAM